MKKIFLAGMLIFMSIFLCACDKKESYILFNKYPFDKDTITSTTNVFKPGERIYYLVTTPKKIESQRLLIQVVKLGKEERLGYDLVWGKQVKMRDEQVYYYTDYVVFNEPGAYLMRAHSKDLPPKLIAANHFYIRN